MARILSSRPNIVFHLIAGYCLLSMALRILRSDSLEIDEAEQAFLSQYLMLGYGTQPPFYNWVQYAVAAVFGLSVAALAVVKNGFLFGFLIFYGFAARTITSERSLPAIAMLGVLTLPPVFLLSQRDLSHTVAALFTVSLFLYGFLQTLKNPRLGSYVVTGIAVGLGVISKYNFVIIPIAAIIAVLPEADLRKRLFDWRVLVAVAIAALIVAPHAYWVLENFGHASGGTVAEMKEGADDAALPHVVEGLFSLLTATVKGIALSLLVFMLIFRKELGRILKAENQWTRIIGRMLVICFVLLVLVVAGIGATHIRPKWLSLFTALLPLYLVLKIDAAGVDATPRLPAFLTVAGILAVGVVVMLWARVFIGPMLGDYSFAHTPYAGFAHAVAEAHQTPPAAVLVDDRIVAGNLRIQFPQIPVVMPGFPAGDVLLPSGPVLAVWPAEGEEGNRIPPRLAKILSANGRDIGSLAVAVVPVPYNAGRAGDLYRFGYTWAP
ncbi:ArnT family glycosyltransferase [Pararhizobium gei]|uniref:ArnT family glycosyltransferase n=1 Tax=Pararhizobium gei TaxID=1395951 RepID=UPI0023D9B3AC|nr:glycosyltransferase family 39 protein [Rhizobium gei]